MAKVMAGVVKDGKKWKIETKLTIEGKTYRIHRRGFDTAHEASHALDMERIRIRNSHNPANSDIFDNVLNEYFSYLETRLKGSTLYNVKLVFKNYLENYYTGLQLEKVLEYEELIKFRNRVNDADVKNDYKNKVIRMYRQFIDYAYKRGLVSRGDFNSANLALIPFKQHTVEVSSERKVWSKEEFKRFLNAIPKDDADYVFFSLWGHIGARQGEIRALQVKHFNHEANTLRIEQAASSKMGIGTHVITSPKNKSSIRTVTLSATISNMLKFYIDTLELDEESFLFSSQSNHKTPISDSSIRRSLKKYSTKAGVILLRPHEIRHSNITWLLNGIKTLDQIGKVSERIGHANKTITLNVYFHINKADNINILDALDFIEIDNTDTK